MPFCQLYTPQNSLYMHLAYLHALKLMNKLLGIAHSTVFRQSISAMFSTNIISQHNLDSNMAYRPSTVHANHSFCIHAGKKEHICHAQYSNYIAVTHNITHSPFTSKSTTHSALPSPLSSTTLRCTELTQAYLCKRQPNGTIISCRDGVKVL